jgi:hypothetical protein
MSEGEYVNRTLPVCKEIVQAKAGKRVGWGRDDGARGPLPPEVHAGAPVAYDGRMFWFTRKKFEGSYFFLRAASRAWLSRKDAWTRSWPSFIMKFV